MKKLFDKAKKIGFINLEPAEQDLIKPRILYLLWKHEGRLGPLWVNLKDAEHDSFMDQEVNVSFPYDLSDFKSEHSELTFVRWYDELDAEDIAEEMGVEFETC